MSNLQISQINPRVTLITEEMPWLKSATMGFFIASGSRDEKDNDQGLTHLTEHMIFKGTRKKSAKDISCIVESLGSTIDGFTAKEISGIYFHYPKENFSKLFDLFFEIMREASFNEGELEKEKNVILQEITTAYEDPQERVYNLFSEIMFPGHPLAIPIAGTRESINQFTRDDLIRYHQNSSLNIRLCVCAAGNVNHAQILDKLLGGQLQYSPLDYWAPSIPPSQNVERALIFETRSNLKQIYTMAGFLTIPLKDERRYGLIILNNIFGGSQSSRLFQRLCEQEGLLYTISTFLDFYSDIGLFCGYHISEIKNRERSLLIAFEEMQKLKKYGITKEEFKRSVNYCKGMTALAAEDPISRITRNAKKYLLTGRTFSIEDSIVAFDNLSFDYVNSLVELFKLEQYSASIVGPITIKDLAKIGVAPNKIIEKKYNNQEDK